MGWGSVRPPAAYDASVSLRLRVRNLYAVLPLLALRVQAGDLAAIDAVRADRSGPSGPFYALEREKGGKHAKVMRYNLNKLHTQTHLDELDARVERALASRTVVKATVAALLTEVAQFTISLSGRTEHAAGLEAIVNKLKTRA